MLPPPSRGRLNAGAVAPSTSSVATSGLADTAGLGGTDRSGFINCLAVGLCDALADVVLAVLSGLLTAALAADLATLLATLAAGFLADVVPLRRAALPAVFATAGFRAGALRLLGAGLEDFLRVFLDIRLPFVAFRRSTIRVLRVSPLTVGFAPAAGQV